MATALDSNVLKWSVNDVLEWASTAGFSNVGLAQATIIEHGINGKILLFVDMDDLKDEFGLSKFEAKAIANAIVDLQDTPEETPVKNGHGDGEGELRLDFYEYRAMNRKEFYKIAGAFPQAPRYALYDIHATFDDHALPVLPIDTVAWVLFPEFWILQHRDAILGGLPFGMIFGISVGLLSKLGQVGMAFSNGKGAILGMILSFFMTEVFVIIFSVIYYNSIWYIVPGFVNDALFWLQMYIFPLCTLVGAFAKKEDPDKLGRERLYEVMKLVTSNRNNHGILYARILVQVHCALQ